MIAHCVSVGDACAHDTPEVAYENLKKTHSLVAEIFKLYLPNIPVFISFGNNDCKYHYDPPHNEEKSDFYDFMYDLWFNKHPAN